MPADDPLVPTEPPLTEVLESYRDAGFDGDAFATDDATLCCAGCGSSVAPDHVEVHSIRRLEGESDPGDMSAVIALICPVCGAHDTAVLRFGPEAGPAEASIWRRLRDERSSDTLPGSRTPSEEQAGSG